MAYYLVHQVAVDTSPSPPREEPATLPSPVAAAAGTAQSPVAAANADSVCWATEGNLSKKSTHTCI